MGRIPFFPQVFWDAHPVDLPVQGALEDRAENPVAGEHRGW
jgi:hypothetical protein